MGGRAPRLLKNARREMWLLKKSRRETRRPHESAISWHSSSSHGFKSAF